MQRSLQSLKKEVNRLDIKKSRCNYFVPNVKDNSICECGLYKGNHHAKAILNWETYGAHRTVNWNAKICTAEDVITDAYGSIEFDDNDLSQTSKYIRVFHHTQMEKITKLLFNYWKLKPPKLIISVTGGAKLDGLNPRLRDVFCNGVVKAAYSTNGWITTGGSYSGIMKYIGEAFKKDVRSLNEDEKITVLGIANWNTVAKRDGLILSENHVQPFEYKLKSYKKTPGVKEELLDPNHSHFILVDNSYMNEFGGEIDFRARLESHLHKTVKIENYEDVPVIMVVIGGGPNTARTVIESIKKKIPCVFVNRSGRFSDIFSFIYETIEMNDEKKGENTCLLNHTFDPEMRSDVERMIMTEFPKKDKLKILGDFEQIFHPRYRHLLSVFDLKAGNNANDIDEAVLKGLLKAKKSHYHSMIRLCLAWNRVDIARNFIFTDDQRDNILSLDSHMENALINNRVEFVELFLEKGYNFRNYLTYGNLLRLYNNVPTNSDFFRLLQDKVWGFQYKKLLKNSANRKAICFTFESIGEVTQQLLQNLYRHRFTQEPFTYIDFVKTSNFLEKIPYIKLIRFRNKWLDKVKSTDEDLNNEISESEMTKKFLSTKCALPEHELFMLNILLQRYDMALIFWREGRNQISSALIATLILNSYLKKYDKDTTKYTSLLKMSKNFESLACQALQLCNSMRRATAQQNLMRKIIEFSDTTTIQISIAAKCMDFISHPVYQNLTVTIWYNKILPDTPKFSIFLSMAMPLLAPRLCHFREMLYYQIKNSNKKSGENKEDTEEDDNFVEADLSVDRTFELNQDLQTNLPLEFLDSETDLKNTYTRNLCYFMRTPLVVFFYNQVFYFGFMLLFSYIMLCDFFPIYLMTNLKIPEILLIICIFSYTLEEIRKVYQYDNKLLKAKIFMYFSDFLNGIQFLAIVFFIVGMILRFIDDKSCYIAARIVLSIDLILWYIKSLVIFTFMKSLGPKITMIGRMMSELAYFLPVILLFMFAYGISSHALQFHNSSMSISLLKNIFFPGYFIIGGEHMSLENMLGVDKKVCYNNFTSIIEFSQNKNCQEPHGTKISLALYVLYLLFMFILLQNLLIAIFSDVYERIDKESDKIWKYQRYFLSYEYFHKPFLVPPFILIFCVFNLIKLIVKLCYKACCRRCVERRNMMNEFFDSMKTIVYDPGFIYNPESIDEENYFIKLEAFVAYEMVLEMNKKKKNTAEVKVTKNNEKTDSIYRQYEGILESRQDVTVRLERIDEKLKLILKYLGKESATKSSIEIKSFKSSKDSTRSAKGLNENVNTKLKAVNKLLNKPPPSPAKGSNNPQEIGYRPQSEAVMSVSGVDLFNESTRQSAQTVNIEDRFIYSDEYPDNSRTKRFTVKKKYVDWSVPWLKYDPVKYTAEEVLLNTKADIDQLAYSSGNLKPDIEFNSFDDKFQVNRVGMDSYEVMEGLPLNPLGRTGIYGRGQLFFWGPNYAVSNIFVNSKSNEVIVSVNQETNVVSFPLVFNENLHFDEAQSLRMIICSIFDNQFLNENKQKFEELIKFVEHTEKVDEYIARSNFNTDNAWIECTVTLYHDELETLTNVPLNEVNSKSYMKNSRLKWMKLDSNLLANLEPDSAKYYDRILMMIS